MTVRALPSASCEHSSTQRKAGCFCVLTRLVACTCRKYGWIACIGEAARATSLSVRVEVLGPLCTRMFTCRHPLLQNRRVVLRGCPCACDYFPQRQAHHLRACSSAVTRGVLEDCIAVILDVMGCCRAVGAPSYVWLGHQPKGDPPALPPGCPLGHSESTSSALSHCSCANSSLSVTDSMSEKQGARGTAAAAADARCLVACLWRWRVVSLPAAAMAVLVLVVVFVRDRWLDCVRLRIGPERWGGRLGVWLLNLFVGLAGVVVLLVKMTLAADVVVVALLPTRCCGVEGSGGALDARPPSPPLTALLEPAAPRVGTLPTSLSSQPSPPSQSKQSS